MMRTIAVANLIWLCGIVTAPAVEQAVRPIDLCFTSGRVIVLGEHGQLVALDAETGEIRARRQTSDRPGALKVFDDQLWLADAAQGMILPLRPDDLGPAGNPIAAVSSVTDFTFYDAALYAAGKWSRRVARVDLEAGQSAGTRRWQTDLNFAPGNVRLLREEAILCVLDAFGDQICLLDADTGRIVDQFAFYGHRLRGLIDDPDGKRLILSHQMLNPTAQTTQNDIHWGMMMSNDVRWLDRTAMLTGRGDERYRGGRIDPIGVVGNGGADPNDLAITSAGMILVPLGGTDELAIGKESDFEYDRLAIGQNPIAVCLSTDERHAWVACKLDDTIWKIDVAKREVVQQVTLSEIDAASPVALGERLFHSGRMAHDQWMTCSSCHPGGHALNERADNLGDGDFGAPKRILSLLGRSETPPFGWTGKDKTLSKQIRRSIQSTMNGPEFDGYLIGDSYADSNHLSDEMVAALTAFVRSLPPPPSIDRERGTADPKLIARGRELFRAHDCNSCHREPKYTSTELFDVGIEDESGRREFNPPSLVGVGQRGPHYFHDLRAESLAAVFTEHHHQLSEPLESDDLAALLAFLRSL